MNDKLFYPLVVIAIMAMVALALVWPQGEGARSPAPFGHDLTAPDRVRAEKDKADRKANEIADAARKAALKSQSAIDHSTNAQSANSPREIP